MAAETPAPACQADWDASRLLPAAEVAKLFGRTLRTLHNWERAGLLVPLRIRGKRYFRLVDIERLTNGGVLIQLDTQPNQHSDEMS